MTSSIPAVNTESVFTRVSLVKLKAFRNKLSAYFGDKHSLCIRNNEQQVEELYNELRMLVEDVGAKFNCIDVDDLLLLLNQLDSVESVVGCFSVIFESNVFLSRFFISFLIGILDNIQKKEKKEKEFVLRIISAFVSFLISLEFNDVAIDVAKLFATETYKIEVDSDIVRKIIISDKPLFIKKSRIKKFIFFIFQSKNYLVLDTNRGVDGVDCLQACNNFNKTIMHLAVEFLDADIVQLLLENGFSNNKSSVRGLSLIALAELLDKTNIIMVLQKAIDEDKKKQQQAIDEDKEKQQLVLNNREYSLVGFETKRAALRDFNRVVRVGKWKLLIYRLDRCLLSDGTVCRHVFRIIIKLAVNMPAVKDRDVACIQDFCSKCFSCGFMEEGLEVLWLSACCSDSMVIVNPKCITDILKRSLLSNTEKRERIKAILSFLQARESLLKYDINQFSDVCSKEHELDEEQQHIIHAVIELGDIEILQMLYENGLDLSRTGILGVSAKQLAESKGEFELAKYIDEKMNEPEKCAFSSVAQIPVINFLELRRKHADLLKDLEDEGICQENLKVNKDLVNMIKELASKSCFNELVCRFRVIANRKIGVIERSVIQFFFDSLDLIIQTQDQAVCLKTIQEEIMDMILKGEVAVLAIFATFLRDKTMLPFTVREYELFCLCEKEKYALERKKNVLKIILKDKSLFHVNFFVKVKDIVTSKGVLDVILALEDDELNDILKTFKFESIKVPSGDVSPFKLALTNKNFKIIGLMINKLGYLDGESLSEYLDWLPENQQERELDSFLECWGASKLFKNFILERFAMEGVISIVASADGAFDVNAGSNMFNSLDDNMLENLDVTKCTALEQALMKCNPWLMGFLFKLGANKQSSVKGYSIVQVALMSNRLDMLLTLLSCCKIEYRDLINQDMLSLLEIADCCVSMFVIWLLGFGVSNAAQLKFKTSLSRDVRFNIVKEILNIIQATQLTKQIVVDFLRVENFISIKDGETLDSRIADRNSKMLDRKTPLEVAIEQGNLEIVKLLVRLGANVNQTTDELKKPVVLAMSLRHRDIAVELMNFGAVLTLAERSRYML